MRVGVSVFLGAVVAWLFSGFIFRAFMGSHAVLMTDGQGFAWIGGTWAVAAVVAYLLFPLVFRNE